MVSFTGGHRSNQYGEIARLLGRNSKCLPLLLSNLSEASENNKKSALHSFATFAVLELIMRLQGFQSGTQEAGYVWDSPFFKDLPDLPVHLFELVPHDSILGRFLFGTDRFARCQIGDLQQLAGYVLMPVYDAETIMEAASPDFRDWLYFKWVFPQSLLSGYSSVSRYSWTIVKMRDAHNREKRFADSEWKGFFD
jgi:hypothetical protein